MFKIDKRKKGKSSCLDSNQGPMACLANTLPLGYHIHIFQDAKKLIVNPFWLFENNFKMPCLNEFSNCAQGP